MAARMTLWGSALSMQCIVYFFNRPEKSLYGASHCTDGKLRLGFCKLVVQELERDFSSLCSWKHQLSLGLGQTLTWLLHRRLPIASPQPAHSLALMHRRQQRGRVEADRGGLPELTVHGRPFTPEPLECLRRAAVRCG
jgi:hypothetical protein